MDPVSEIERKLLELPPVERERLALKAWESLVNDPIAASDIGIDPDGVKVAAERDSQLDQGTVDPINDDEFRRRTGGDE